MTTFVALDFETADRYRDSACAIGLVRVEQGQVVDKVHYLIRPPRRVFEFTHIHGITWRQVANEPDFAGLWPDIAAILTGADFFVAHNASFDRSVLHACCQTYGILPPVPDFVCTVKLARQAWNLRPTKLPNVCDYLGIPLNHHDALSDAEACAKIAMLIPTQLVASASGASAGQSQTPRPTDLGRLPVRKRSQGRTP